MLRTTPSSGVTVGEEVTIDVLPLADGNVTVTSDHVIGQQLSATNDALSAGVRLNQPARRILVANLEESKSSEPDYTVYNSGCSRFIRVIRSGEYLGRHIQFTGSFNNDVLTDLIRRLGNGNPSKTLVAMNIESVSYFLLILSDFIYSAPNMLTESGVSSSFLRVTR